MKRWIKSFRRRKSLGAGFSEGSRSDALAQRLAAAIVRRQQRLASWLARKTQHWNRASKLIALYLFCLVFGGLSLWLLIRAFF